MPELPEVETICRTLEPRIKGRLITRIELGQPNLLRETTLETLKGWLGARLLKVRRRGKTILIDSDRNETMLIHLKMTGQLFLTSSQEPVDKHVRLILGLSRSKLELRLRDMRKFGYLTIFSTSKERELPFLCRLGLEPSELNLEKFICLVQGHKGRIKPLLLRQDFIAGIGNIYADEILYEAKIHPERLVNTLSHLELSSLYKAMRRILSWAIKLRGTSVRSYRDGFGEPGSFQRQLKVYGREGQTCFRCKSLIQRKKVGGRSAFFCPHCQLLAG